MSALIELCNTWQQARSSGAEARIQRHLCRFPEIRLPRVKGSSRDYVRLPGDLSTMELVAAFSLLQDRIPLAALIQQLDGLESGEGEERFSTGFFEALLATAQVFAFKDLRVQASSLLRLGRALAKRQKDQD